MSTEPEFIKNLLKKYYDGSTSVDEELILKKYFSKDNVTDEFTVDKKLFSYLSEMNGSVNFNSNLEKKLIRIIDFREKNERKNYFIHNRFIYGSIAAGIAMLITCYLLIYQQQHQLKLKDSYKDSKLAYIEVKRSLYYISERLNKGTEPLKRISDIDKGFSHLSAISYLGSGLNGLDLIPKYYDNSKIEKNKK